MPRPVLDENTEHEVYWVYGGQRIFKIHARKQGEIGDWYWRVSRCSPEDAGYIFVGMTIGFEDAHTTKEAAIKAWTTKKRRSMNQLLNQLGHLTEQIKQAEKL